MSKVATLFALDRIGTCLSGLCAVHCAAMPFLLLALPVLGSSVLADPRWEIAVILSSAVIGSMALFGGHRRHGRLRPLGFFLSGMVLFGGARALAHFSGEPCCGTGHGPNWPVAGLSFLGGAMVVTGHLGNSRLLHRFCDHVH